MTEMKPGVVLEAARKDGSATLTGALMLVAVCGGVLGLNWKYVYNYATGPYRFSSELAAQPGAREFVAAEGELMPTGLLQQTTMKLLRGLVQTTSVSANYLAMRVDGRLLIVKTAPEHAGKRVEGRLQALSEDIRASVGSDAVYPWLIDATTAYRWDFNLFVMIAGPLFPLTLLFAGWAAWQKTRIDRHSAIARLAKHGDPLQVVAGIEAELVRQGPQADAGRLWIGTSWIVVPTPVLYIFKVSDLVGIGAEGKPGTASSFTVYFWVREQRTSTTVSMSEAEAKQAIQAVKARWPWAIVEEAAAFEKRWREDPTACATAADTRRGAA